MVAKKSVKKTQTSQTSSSKSTSKKGPSKLQIGAVIGGITAAAAALFLAPKLADPKKRKALAKKVKNIKNKLAISNVDQKVKDIFGESTAKTKKIYEQAKDGVVLKIAELKDSEVLDSKKYVIIVNQVLGVIKKEYSEESQRIGKLKDQLMEDWKKLDSKKKTGPAKKSPAKKTSVKKPASKKAPAKKSPAKK